MSVPTTEIRRLMTTVWVIHKRYGYLIWADGHVYFRYQDGLVVLVEATETEYREKGSFMIPDVKRESWSHPVISNDRLYLKEHGRILYYDIKAHKPA